MGSDAGMTKIKRPAFVTPERWRRGEVGREDHADPDRPMRDQSGVQTGYHSIRGVRAAQGGHDYLHRRGSLDAAQHRAADRYHSAWHGLERSGSALGGSGGVRLPLHQQGCPTASMVACAADMRAANDALGTGARILVHQVVVQGWTLGTVGGGSGENDQVTLGRLRAALDRLVEIWGIE